MTSLSQNTPSPIASLEASQTASMQETAARIRSLNRNMSASIIEIGRELLHMKAMMVHGTFTRWVENDCGLKRRSCQNYMLVAAFVADKSASVALLSPAVLYRLAAKSAPADVVFAVLRLVEDGSIPNEFQVDQLFASAPRSAASILEAGIDDAALLAAELLSSVGTARAQELLSSWKLVGKHLGILVEQQSVVPTPMMRGAGQELGPGLALVRDPNNEDCFTVRTDDGDRERVAPPEHPAAVTGHPNQTLLLEHVAQAHEPGTTAAAESGAAAGQPDFMTDSEGLLHGIPDFLRYTNRR